jgi:hypothetical protein
VTSYPGQPSVAELARLAASGERPRKDYVELARAVDGVVIDHHYMAERALTPARAIAARAGLPNGKVAEAFLRQREFGGICAWADRLGLPLALLFKLAGGRRDTVMVSMWSSRGKKAIFLERLKAWTHLGAMVHYSSVQLEIAATTLGVPRDKLQLLLQPVDERFWRPEPVRAEDLICAVGWEARDYPTLVKAMRGLDLRAELAVGSIVMPSDSNEDSPVAAKMRGIVGDGLPPNVKLLKQLTPRELRQLYARSRFAVVPVEDVEFDAGVTAIAEAMAMGKAVIVTRTRGQVDIIRDGEHGLYVPPEDPAALRRAIEHLAAHPDEAERMGRAGRALIEQRHTLDGYVGRLAALMGNRRAASGRLTEERVLAASAGRGA